MEQGSKLYINLLLWTTLVSFVSAKVQWRVVEQITNYGQDLTLFCTADGFSVSSISTKRWYGGPEHKMLSLNGVAANTIKHNATVEKEGFSLIIKNFSTTDVNVTYSCTFGFNEAIKVLTEIDVFKSQPVDHDREQQTLQHSDINLQLILGVVIGLLAIVSLIAITMIIRKKRLGERKQRRGPYNSEEELQPLNQNGSDLPPTETNEVELQTLNRNRSDLPPPETNEVELQPLNQNGSNLQTTETNVDINEQNSRHTEESHGINKDIPDRVREHGSADTQHKYPAYRDEDLRTKSFTTWDHVVSPAKLAAAGFFYSGFGCRAKCFSCGKLVDWKDPGDPMHVQFHDDCKHLHDRRNICNGISHETSPKSDI